MKVNWWPAWHFYKQWQHKKCDRIRVCLSWVIRSLLAGDTAVHGEKLRGSRWTLTLHYKAYTSFLSED